ncbi:P27 family phage terminase small subunit [Steroidobacter sp.]|uniref:P27 family phage terminase small subunit n=1 Tax=Steroidobacter sp. TaxID=1978227 RepID=UPI0039F5766E
MTKRPTRIRAKTAAHRAKTTAQPVPFPESGDVLRKKLLREFVITDAAGLALLQSACVALDAALQAEVIVHKDGPVVRGHRGMVAHPCIKIARDARHRMLVALKALRLERDE